MKYLFLILLIATDAHALELWVKKSDSNNKTPQTYVSKQACEKTPGACFESLSCPKDDCAKKEEKDGRMQRLKAAKPSDPLLKDILEELLSR